MDRRSFLQLAAAASLPAAQPDASELLSGARLHDLSLEMDPGDWATLKERYLTNDWYWCQVNWNGISVKAAVRSRGNGSRHPVKPSLKLSFTRSRDSGPFLGLAALLVNNCAQDASCLRNALSQALFAKMGLPAPRTAYARVLMNGEYQGLHALTEEIDSAYLQRWFGQSDGWLYEYAWSDYYYFEKRGGQDTDYVPEPFEPKNNTRNPQAATLRRWIETINDAPDDALLEQLAPYMDVRQYLTFLAVETFTDERDGQTGDWGLNGFFLYRFLNSSKFSFLSWDKDWSFQNYGRPLLYQTEQNVLARRLLQNRTGRSFFLDELERCARLAGAAGGWLENEARTRTAAIWQAAHADPHFITGTGHFAPESAKVMEFVQRRSTEVLRQTALLRGALR